jgi:hypothetical protein
MSSRTLRQPEALQAGAARARAASLVLRLAIVCTILAGLVLSGQFVRSGIQSVGRVWPVTHPEGATIAAILRVRDGEPVYQDFMHFPHVITPYPPLQPAVVGLTARVLGLSIMETVGLARSLTLASALATTVLIWLIAVRLGAGRLAALAGAALFLPLPALDEWGFASRPDVPAVALSLAAMLLLLVRPQRVWLAAVVAVAAVFTKQTAVALPVAATLWLLLSGRWRAALVFAGTWSVLVSALVGLLQVGTGGNYVLNTVLAHLNTPKNGFDFARRDIMPLFSDGWLPLALAAGTLAIPSVWRAATLPLLYLAAATALAFYSLRNTGGDVNYLIEPAAAACVPAALAVGWLWRRAAAPVASGRGGRGVRGGPADQTYPREYRRGLLPLAGAVALAAAAVVWAAGFWEFWQLDGGVDSTGRLPLAEIGAADSVLSEEPLAVLLAGKPLLVSDTFHLSMLTTSGFFDPLELERRIKRSEFDLIVMRNDIRAPRSWKRQLLLPEGVRLAIKDTYIPDGRVGMFWLYKPEEPRPSR